MKEIWLSFRRFLRDRFTLDEDKADEQLIVESIERNIHFKGTNLWTLIFAILIASIGLNVNSTAVIIGAMLISPLMGPIMGIGLGFGIMDIGLMKRGAKNLFIAAAFSILTSFLYFSLSPLHEAKSEILARTNPSIWDVMIAFFGGMAGIIAGTRREKTNILPGVAIATALMPPLCTAGFGIATGQLFYVAGALYLFFINGLFICLATFIIVRYLRFKVVQFAAGVQRRRMMRYTWIIVLLTVLPSIYLAFRIVQRAIFEENARSFVQHSFKFANTQVVHQSYHFDTKKPSVEVLLIGQELDSLQVDSIRLRMPEYRLDPEWLTIRQGLDAKKQIDFAQIRASILEDVFSKAKDTLRPAGLSGKDTVPDLSGELRVLYPDVLSYSIIRSGIMRGETARNDTLTLVAAVLKREIPSPAKNRLAAWLKQRVSADSLMLFTQVLKEK